MSGPDKAKPCHVRSEHVRLYQFRSGQTKSLPGLVRSRQGHVGSCQAGSGHDTVRSNQVGSGRVASCVFKIVLGLVMSGQVISILIRPGESGY